MPPAFQARHKVLRKCYSITLSFGVKNSLGSNVRNLGVTLEACDDERLFIIKFFAKKRHGRSCHFSSRASTVEEAERVRERA
jgi:hypothetical protein